MEITKDIISDFLKVCAYMYHRGVYDAASMHGDYAEIDTFLKETELCEPKHFRFIANEDCTSFQLGNKAFKRLFVNIITRRLPGFEKRRELCKGFLFTYIYSHGYYANEIYQMAIYEYRRGIEAGASIPLPVAEEFMARFYTKFEYGDIDPISHKYSNRTKSSYNIHLMYKAGNDLHVKRRQALSEGKNVSSKLENFAVKLQQISFYLD